VNPIGMPDRLTLKVLARRIVAPSLQPVIGIIAGATATAFLVPYLTAGAQRESNRLALATELIQHGTQVRRALNQLQVALANCYQDHGEGDGASADDRTAIRAAHREFDALAWWEHSNILVRAQLTNAITVSEERRLKASLAQFKSALNGVSRAITPMWNACLRDPKQLEGATGKELYDKTMRTLGKIGTQLSDYSSRASWELSVRR
jgi:hypothetical protein